MERAAGSERTPLLAGQNSSDALGLDHHLDMDCSSRRRTLAHQQGGEVPDESLLSGSPLHSYSPLSVFFVFFFPALGGLLFGYDIGGTSAALEQLESTASSGVSWYAASTFLQGFITSTGVAGAIAGSLICFNYEKVLGRRVELILSAILYTGGALLEVLSGLGSIGSVPFLSITILLIGRVVYGTGIGFAMHGAPAYISEMSPPDLRGILVSLKECFIVLGILLGYCMGYATDDIVGGWRIIYAASIVPALTFMIGMYFMPSSARWLLLRGRPDEAHKSLAFVNPQISDEDFNQIAGNASKAVEAGNVTLADLWQPRCRHALVAGVGIVLLQQLTGQPSVLYYAGTIFEDIGMSASAPVIIGAFKMAATLTTVFSVDKFGRRRLLTVGCMLMLVALLTLGTAFIFGFTSEVDCNVFEDEETCVAFSDMCAFEADCSCVDVEEACTCCSVVGFGAQKIVILCAMLLYIGGYQIGFGPVGWVVISEIFPLRFRGKALSVAVIANFSSNLFVTFFFPVLLRVVGPSATFYIFAAVDIYAIIFIYLRVPETRSMSLEQIERMFARIGKESTVTD